MKNQRKRYGGRKKSPIQSPFENDSRSAGGMNYYGLDVAEGEEKSTMEEPQTPASRPTQPSKRLRILSQEGFPPPQKKKEETGMSEEDGQLRAWDSGIVLFAIFSALALLLLIIIVVYVYLGTLIYRDGYPSPLRKSDLYFSTDHLNFTNAIDACNKKDMDLAVFFTELEENRFFDKIYANATILDNCPTVFIGYRIAADREWNGPKNETAFGATFSDMWEKTTYDLELETCSQAIKIADYRLNNVVCDFPSDCAVCETASSCPNKEPTCYFLERLYPKANHSMANAVCDKNYQGHLALIRSEAIRLEMIDLLLREDPLQVCKAVAVGMKLNRQVETIHGLDMAYKSTRIKLNQGDAMNYCLSAKTRANDIGILSTQSCTEKACYACRK